jgi:signal transduction histidine kinase/FixJ family two-component response regulator
VAVKNKRINLLLVDPNEDDLKFFRDLFSETKRWQIDLKWVATYDEGLRAAAANQHDLYLVHLCQNDRSGLDLVRQAIKDGCTTPIILLSEQVDQNLEVQADLAGAADLLVRSQLRASQLGRAVRYAVERAQVEELLRETRRELDQQVNESLERRTRQVQTSTEIAQEIATTPRTGELFRQVVNLVQKQFGYYHAHVYTAEGDDLVMQEGTGDASETLKLAGHKIPLNAERSLVAFAARNGEPVLVADVYLEPNWLPNPLLPETKSEIAVPIKLRDEVLGVLDVQSDTVASLGQEDQILLMGLCGQIAVAINSRRLEAKRREAEENRAKLIEDLDGFAHMVGYNLREPLALIIGYAELLKEQARLPEELQGYLNAIARNGHKMGNIIDELQLLTGVRKAEADSSPLNMPRIVAEVQQRLAYLIDEYRAKIIVSEYWPVALGHKPWVEEVLTNYLSNAIRFGGTPPHVQVGATAQSDGMVRFWVRDNGPGFNRQDRAQLFTEFKNLGQVNVQGYGLGLSIVQRIITKLGGQVGVESDGVPGKGSIFYFTLPEYQP